jgi:hypothetical protein
MSDPLGGLLCSMYLVLFGLTGWQFLRAVRNRAQLLSFRQSILFTCLLWLPMRTVFWAKTTSAASWPPFAISFLFYIPDCLQFSSYALLATFEGFAIHHKRWHGGGGCLSGSGYRWRYVTGNVVSNLAVWGATLSTNGLVDADAGESSAGSSSQRRSIVIGGVFLLLSALIVWHGWLFSRLSRADLQQVQVPLSPRRMFYINASLSAVFATRAVDDLLLQSVNVLPVKEAHVEVSGEPLYFGVFLLYVLWEVCPMVVVLVMTWIKSAAATPSAGGGKGGKRGKGGRGGALLAFRQPLLLGRQGRKGSGGGAGDFLEEQQQRWQREQRIAQQQQQQQQHGVAGGELLGGFGPGSVGDSFANPLTIIGETTRGFDASLTLARAGIGGDSVLRFGGPGSLLGSASSSRLGGSAMSASPQVFDNAGRYDTPPDRATPPVLHAGQRGAAGGDAAPTGTLAAPRFAPPRFAAHVSPRDILLGVGGQPRVGGHGGSAGGGGGGMGAGGGGVNRGGVRRGR